MRSRPTADCGSGFRRIYTAPAWCGGLFYARPTVLLTPPPRVWYYAAMYTTLLCAGTLTARRMGIGGGNEYPPFRISCRIIPAYQSSRLFCIHHTPHFDNVSFVGDSPEPRGNSFPQAGKYAEHGRNSFPQVGKYPKQRGNLFPQVGKYAEQRGNVSAQVGKYPEHGRNWSQRDALLTEFCLARTARIFASQKPSKLASAQVGICPEPCGGSAARFCAGLYHIGIVPPRVCGGIFRMKRRLA